MPGLRFESSGADFAAWDSEALTAALSFGFVDASAAETVLVREVTVANYSDAEATFAIDPSFRFENTWSCRLS